MMGVGAGVKLAGLAHLGLGGEITEIDDEAGFPGAGWEYGFGYAGPVCTEWLASSVFGDFYPPASLMKGRGFSHLEEFPCRTHGGLSGEHDCYFLLPAVFSVTERDTVWEHVHAFDIGVSHFTLLGLRIGFSPGEFVDFVLGWFGVDIALDDKGPIMDRSEGQGNEANR